MYGLIFIWDEFTDFFKNNRTRLSGLQALVEMSEGDFFYLIPVTHNVANLFPAKDKDWNVISHRFVLPFCNIELPDNMAFRLMGKALEKRQDTHLMDEWQETSEELYERTRDARALVKKQAKMDEYQFMFGDLPGIFRIDGALLDRFHGFIKGWDIPQVNDGMKICGWALNSEYFCTIMHLLREDISYRAIVDQLLEVPDDAYTRDTEAVKRIATAYLKLLFPQVKTVEDVNPKEFKRYCLTPACKMRRIIRMQISMFDSSYNSELPQFTIREVAK